MGNAGNIQPVQWRNDSLVLLDQRRLPAREEVLVLETVEEVTRAITDLVVRGAPAIGIAAAYGVVLAARSRLAEGDRQWRSLLCGDLELLAAARPTAVNLAWAVARMRACMVDVPESELLARLLDEACAIHAEDVAANQRMGMLGAALIDPGSGVLTHCNAGALATGGYGTALGVIRSAWHAGKLTRVFADETRPWLQGSRLTAWELARSEIPVTVIADSAAATLMREGRIQWVVVGADRVAANGDVINKIGTYSLAVLARAHGVRFMVVAPTSTIDLDTASGEQVPIEVREWTEIWAATGSDKPPQGVDVLNRVFDVTPAELISAIVTEKGVLAPVSGPGIESLQKG
ncbi:MAG: S-methyl-5-thioribose-1-phosphate isomerase [Gammaproteobacteria bacterium]|jgi:methylthioribose-1-phosphate isomerase|nr:S-methyl-5-thioribose-1-phosphate isomerase [Gammaproteobacteria bacterium]